MHFHSIPQTTLGYCSYGDATSYDCNAWAKTNNCQNHYSDIVEKDAYINTYLNNNYLTTLDKTYLSPHTYNIGPVTFAGSILENTLQAEKQITWQGYIGLPNISGFLNSNTNPNYGFTHCVYVLFPADNLYPGVNANNPYNISPVMYLKSNIILSGNGTIEAPYEPHIISN